MKKPVAAVIFGLALVGCAALILGCADFFVSDSSITAVAVTAPTSSLQVAVTQQYTATGTQAGGGTQDVTGSASWSTGNSAIATISSSGATAGLLTTIAPGSTTVTATLSGVSGSTSLSVTGGALQSITISAPDSTVQKGSTLQFTANGTFSGSTTPRDITGAVTWVSSDPNVATISSTGLATGVSAGTTIIAANLGGVVSGPLTLTVTVGP